jgi:hypothetical protein
MALIPKYTPVERATLTMCIQPVERWSEQEHRAWARTGTGFRYYLDPKIVCIEHFRRPPERRPPAATTRKPAA